MNKTIKILENLKIKKFLKNSDLEYLLTQEKNNSPQKNVWNASQDSISERIDLFVQVVEEVMLLLTQLKFPQPEACLETLWNLWLPLTIQLADLRRKQDYPLIQGILGGQGTGKTTLTTVIDLLLQQLGYSSIGISIDDIYKTYPERQALLKQDSRLIWRGPPCTHDLQLGLKVLDDLRYGNQSLSIPRFDKSLHNGSGDRISPQLIDPVDIILFEGWFVGAIPVDENVFLNPPFPIVTPEDIKFAQDMNQNLKQYLPLWQKLDRLMILYPTDYCFSLQWRKDAEHKMIATGKSGMSDQEIEEFVYYFWKSLHPELFIKPLTKNSNLTDLVIEINENHSLGNIYSP